MVGLPNPCSCFLQVHFEAQRLRYGGRSPAVSDVHAECLNMLSTDPVPSPYQLTHVTHTSLEMPHGGR